MPFQKKTLQEHTKPLFVFFVGLCVYQNLTNHFFNARSRQKRQILEIFAFLTTLRSFEELF